MRLSIALSPLLLLAACAPVREAPPFEASGPAYQPAAVAKPVEPPRPMEPARATRATLAGISFEGAAFDSRSHHLIVADQPGGPGSRFADAAAAGRAHGGIAAVNAGFFTPEGDPLGRVIASGKSAGAWNRATSLGSGVWFETHSGATAIRRRENVGSSGMRDLLQAGPMLVEDGRAVPGLDRGKTSARTLIAWDGGTRWWIGRTDPCTLEALGRALAAGAPAGWPVKHALNLDGGRSSDLWVSSGVPGGPLSIRPVWNRPVRNFLILLPR